MKKLCTVIALSMASTIIAVPCGAEELAARTLPRGTILTASDISGDDQDLLGLEVIRNIRKGNRVDRTFLREPHIVKRNDRVTLVFIQGRLRLETTGRSLGSGALGDRVTIMNTDSRQKVVGYISGPGSVEVRP